MGLALKPRELINFLEDNGFRFERQNGTSHAMYKKGNRQVPVPIHAKDIKIGTLSSMLRQAGLSRKELEVWLGR